MVEIDDDYRNIAVIVVVVLIVCSIAAAVYFYVTWKQAQPRPPFYETAPNGTYRVLPMMVNATHVTFPACSSHGGDLCGTFKKTDEVFMVPNMWYSVRLVGNVIVEARELYHMSPV